MPDSAQTPRQRYRAQVQDEIKQAALDQIAEGGTGALSLNAIAKSMGVSGPALYKYFRNRDDLLTALIEDGYGDVAAAVRGAAEGAAQLPARARLHALAEAYRAWALGQPHRYLLLAGTPSAGYQAPPHTVDSARAVLGPFLAVLGAGRPWPAAEALHGGLRRWVEETPAVGAWVHEHAPQADPVPVLAAVLVLWSRLHGVVSLEVEGHYQGMGHDPGALLAVEMDALADALGLAPVAR
ncbi:TetR/AcrR family transcriptional regulator [Kitasatospora paranensis]|uniref:TetR/AcrR family transcriptional regulator n=1 Tax=Kitasatospora paranensis TaxID=258053 RepID=A0ABW2G2Z6_9ACTN